MYMLMTSLRDEAVVSQLLRMELAEDEELPEVTKKSARKLVSTGSFSEAPAEPAPADPAPQPAAPQVKRPAPGEEARAAAQEPGIGRNDPCPCGSGRKFKKCCGGPTAGAATPA